MRVAVDTDILEDRMMDFYDILERQRKTFEAFLVDVHGPLEDLVKEQGKEIRKLRKEIMEESPIAVQKKMEENIQTLSVDVAKVRTVMEKKPDVATVEKLITQEVVKVEKVVEAVKKESATKKEVIEFQEMALETEHHVKEVEKEIVTHKEELRSQNVVITRAFNDISNLRTNVSTVSEAAKVIKTKMVEQDEFQAALEKLSTEISANESRTERVRERERTLAEKVRTLATKEELSDVEERSLKVPDIERILQKRVQEMESSMKELLANEVRLDTTKCDKEDVFRLEDAIGKLLEAYESLDSGATKPREMMEDGRATRQPGLQEENVSLVKRSFTPERCLACDRVIGDSHEGIRSIPDRPVTYSKSEAANVLYKIRPGTADEINRNYRNKDNLIAPPIKQALPQKSPRPGSKNSLSTGSAYKAHAAAFGQASLESNENDILFPVEGRDGRVYKGDPIL